MFEAYQPSARISLPAAVNRYLEVALYLLVATGFATLASTGGLDFPSLLLVGTALLLRGYSLARRLAWLLPERWTTILTLVYVVLYLADYFLISRSFLNATVHLVLFVMVVRMFSVRRDRDYYFLAAIAFLMVLAAAVLTVDSIFLLSFAVFMLTAVMTFVLMEMRYSAGVSPLHAREPNDNWAHRRLAFSLAGAAPTLVVLILMGAAAIFFVLPRMSAGYLSARTGGRELATGFSQQVQLGRIGQIQQSSAVVMHIEIDGDTSGSFDLKWRGVSLNDFNGTVWSNPHEKFVVPRQLDGNFMLASGAPAFAARGSRLIHYRVLMEPVGTDVFFLAAEPRSLQGYYRQIAIDGGGGVFNLDPEHSISRYDATSLLANPNAADLRRSGTDYPPEILLSYLQLPALDVRIPRLASEITASASNNYDRAVALENYLRTHYEYTLQLPRVLPHDPLANFLFERKRGHCEYFASAMAIMLRALRIPSRVVTGFRTGEFNDLTSQYVVRASNAHAWVEAYFPGRGWVSFDPTPAAMLPPRTTWGRVSLYLDAMASFWREWVVNYDSSHQQQLGEGATRTSRQWLYRLQQWARIRYRELLKDAHSAQQTLGEAPTEWTAGAVLSALLLVLAANAGRIWRMLRRHRLAAHPRRSPRQAATIWYERMIQAIARRGWKKLPAQTPAEFATSIPDSAVRESVARFSRHYEQARFGDSAEDAERLPELFEEVASAAKK